MYCVDLHEHTLQTDLSPLFLVCLVFSHIIQSVVGVGWVGWEWSMNGEKTTLSPLGQEHQFACL